MRGRYGNRVSPRFAGRANKPTRTWASVAAEFFFNAVSAAQQQVILIQLQAPAALSNLTSDPPEDLTVLRLRGEFNVTLAGSATASWTLGLIVTDTVWTPGTFTGDCDKRWLWTRSFQATNATSDTWTVPGSYIASGSGATIAMADPNCTQLDIAPKVKIEPGRALILVAYENAGAGTLTVTSPNMRVLFQRTRRGR